MSRRIQPIPRDLFIRMPHSGEDHFAQTFRAKADLMDLWPCVVGFFEIGEVLSAICIRNTRTYPIVANLQLLHTFAKHRRKGLARELVLNGYRSIRRQTVLGLGGPEYFRVSSEPDAAAFYRSLGLKFWGRQKSGSLLCIHRIRGDEPSTGEYKLDAFIESQLHSGRRGSLVETFSEPH